MFKEFVSRAKKLYSEKYLDKELSFLIDMFAENKQQATKTESNK